LTLLANLYDRGPNSQVGAYLKLNVSDIDRADEQIQLPILYHRSFPKLDYLHAIAMRIE
jgi:hypothetical protein